MIKGKVIELCAVAYNEGMLMAAFLDHYINERVDIFTLIIDADTNDNTNEIIREYQAKTHINTQSIKFEAGINESEKISCMNKCYRNSKADYFIVADVDEFAILPYKLTDNIYLVELWEVYQHRCELPYDYSLPLTEQRSYGKLERIYCKPMIAKTNLAIGWGVGHHTIKHTSNYEASNIRLHGHHVRYADKELIYNRIVKNRTGRQSDYNRQHLMDDQWDNIQPDNYDQLINDNNTLPRMPWLAPPLLSVIILTIDDRAAMLDKLLSILAPQLTQECELIIINNPNQTIGANRQSGLDKAKGDYVVYIDDDDVIAEEYITSILNGCRMNVDAICFYVMVMYMGNWKRVKYSKDYKPNCLKGEFLRKPNHIMAIRRKLITDIGFKNVWIHEDDILSEKLNIQSEHHINMPLYWYNPGRAWANKVETELTRVH